MQRIIYKIMFSLLLLTIIFICSCSKSFADEELNVMNIVSEIKNVYNSVSNTYTYMLEAKDDVAKLVLAEPIYVETKFENTPVDNDGSASVKSTIDFSQINFNKVGYYRFIISEVNSSNIDTFPVSAQRFEIIVSVSYDESRNLQIRPKLQVINLDSNEKTELKFEHQTNRTYINIEDYTIGQFAEQDKNVYFKYKLSILGNVGDRYRIIGQDKEVSFDGEKITTEDYYEVKSGEDNYIYVYLKHGQNITIGLSDDNINQIDIGTKYKVAKIGARKWSTTINNVQTDDINYLVAGAIPEENLIIIINERNFDVAITGVFIDILPFAILIVIAIVRNNIFN